MSKWTSDARQRKSKRYIELHERLKAECASKPVPDTDKRERKRIRSEDFRAGRF